MSTRTVSPRRRPRREMLRVPPDSLRANTLTMNQSRLRSCSMARSSNAASNVSSGVWTTMLRSNSSAITSVSMARRSNRRMLTRPVVMTCPASTLVTRVIGTNTRRRPATSTTRPITRGALRRGLKCTTTSETRPTGSARGSNTLSPARRATKTRVMGLRLQGYPDQWRVPRRHFGRPLRCQGRQVSVVAGVIAGVAAPESCE